MPEMTEKIIIGVIVGVIGAVIVHRLTLRRNRWEKYLQAGVDFREVFIPAIDRLKHGPVEHLYIDTYSILTHALREQRIAYERFRLYLPWFKRKGLDRAWQQYLNGDGKETPEPFDAYVDAGDISESELHALALRRIEKLLSYAKIS